MDTPIISPGVSDGMCVQAAEGAPFDRPAKGALESIVPGTSERCRNGWVGEWTKAAVLKTAVRVTVPGGRIHPHPLEAGRR